MDDAAGVRCIKGLSHLSCQTSRPLFREASPLEYRRKRWSLGVFEDKKSTPFLVLTNIMQRHDSRVRNPREGSGLLLHALHEQDALVWLKSKIRTQVLDGHPSAQHGVVGEENDPHRALAQLLKYLVSTDGL
jgi:hypothetical protein